MASAVLDAFVTHVDRHQEKVVTLSGVLCREGSVQVAADCIGAWLSLRMIVSSGELDMTPAI
jgi:hypothetical protein